MITEGAEEADSSVQEEVQVEEAVEYLRRITQTALDNLHGDDLITLLDREIIPAINASLATMEASGDLLPTFYRTYSDYLKILFACLYPYLWDTKLLHQLPLAYRFLIFLLMMQLLLLLHPSLFLRG